MDKVLALLKKLGAKDEEIASAKEELETAQEAAIELEVTGLKTKNTQLLEKLKAKPEGDGGKVAELEVKLEELTDANAKLKRESEKSIKTLTAERDDYKAKLSDTATKAREYETGVSMREALSKVGIGKLNAEDVTDAIAHIKGMLKYNDDGEAMVVYKDAAGKAIEQKLGEYVEKVYPTTSHAKRFLPADMNRGGGGRKPLVKPDGTAKTWAEMDLRERTELHKADPERAKALQAAE